MARLTLKHAKDEALELLQSSWPTIEYNFANHIKKNLAWQGQIYLDKAGAEKRLRDAVFIVSEDQAFDENGDHMYNGMTDGDIIWIERGIEYEQMIGTLVHEALHDCVFLVRPTRSCTYRRLSCEFEHAVFESLPIEGI
jgi:hypothetical protein